MNTFINFEKRFIFKKKIKRGVKASKKIEILLLFALDLTARF